MKPVNYRSVAFLAILAVRASAGAPTRIAISSVTGRFFANESDAGGFSAKRSSRVVFSQQFAAIDFNPPAGALPCKNRIDVNEDTRPFTNVVARPDGSCSTVAAQGNGQRAGVDRLESFNAVFTGTFTLSAAGRVTFNIYADDGWILGIGRQGGMRPSFVRGLMNQAPAETPFSRLPVVGANNTTSAPARNDLVVDFPAPGVYDFELDYSECCQGQLAITLTADAAAMASSASPFDPALDVLALAIAVSVLTGWRSRNEQRRRRDLGERGFAVRLAGDVRGGPQAAYRMEIRGAENSSSGRLGWDE